MDGCIVTMYTSQIMNTQKLSSYVQKSIERQTTPHQITLQAWGGRGLRTRNSVIACWIPYNVLCAPGIIGNILAFRSRRGISGKPPFSLAQIAAFSGWEVGYGHCNAYR